MNNFRCSFIFLAHEQEHQKQTGAAQEVGTMYSRKLERMHRPSSDINKYDDEEYMKNPLLTFRISEVHERRHYTFLKQRAADIKVKISRKPWAPDPDIRALPQTHYVDNLRRQVRKIIVPRMLVKTEAKILSFASDRLKKLYPDLVKEYMADVHAEFDRLMKIYSMQNILHNPEFLDEDPSIYDLPRADFHFKLPGRSRKYKTYLENRRKIAQSLLIVQLPMRVVLSISVAELPEFACNFEYVSSLGAQQQQIGLCGRESLSYKFYRKYIQNQLDKVNTFLRWTWYTRLVLVLKRMLRKRLMPQALWKRAWTGLEGLMNREVNNMKQRTFEEMFRICAKPTTMPMFRVSLFWNDMDDCIEMRPSMYSIQSCFGEIVTEISTIGNRMDPLQPQVDTNTIFTQVNDYLKIEMNEHHVKDMCNKVAEIIEKTYTELTDYINGFKTRYLGLYSVDERENLTAFLEEPHEFEEYFERINTYYEYINMLTSEPATDYFAMAIVDNEPIIDGLRSLAQNLIAEITTIIIREHIRVEEEICEVFEKIKEKALVIPKSTEELLESADFMISVKTVKLAELTDRIQHCLQVGTNIVELTQMSKYHFDLTIKTINWIKDINEICDYNASQQEQYKFTFEEHLQEVVKKLNVDIQEMLPKLTVIDDMSRPDKFRESYIVLQNFIDQLKTFDDYVAWINKEEKLFKVNQTQYPSLQVIKTFVYPFTELMK